MRYIKAPVAFTATSKSSTNEVVAANAKRTYLMICNNSDTVCYLAFGEASVASYGVRLNANGGSYEMCEALGNLTQSAVNSINATGDKNLCGVEASN
jgi:hypothetical protein